MEAKDKNWYERHLMTIVEAKLGVSSHLVVRENFVVDGKKVRIAATSKDGKYVAAGISEEKYNQHKDYIDAKFAEIESKMKVEEAERNLRNNWIVAALSDEIITVVEKGEDFDVTTLTAEVPREVWAKIKHLAHYVNSDEDMEGGCDWTDGRFKGWAVAPAAADIIIAEAEKVATSEQREMAKKILAEREEARKKREERKAIKLTKEKLLSEIMTAFENAEKPKGEFSLEGEEIENPFYPIDSYGGGQWFVIEKDYIWLVQNNGHDGDNWGLNNVETGGAGAIGKRVIFTCELANKIRGLEKVV